MTTVQSYKVGSRESDGKEKRKVAERKGETNLGLHLRNDSERLH